MSVLLVSIAAIIYWDTLMVRYHLLLLANTPDYFEKIFNGPEGTKEMAAVRLYMASKEGKAVLIRNVIPDLVLQKLAIMRAKRTKLCVHANNEAVVVLDFTNDGMIGNFYIPVSLQLTQLITEFLVDKECYTIDEYPEIRVEFLSSPPEGAEEYCGLKR
jgi:hypothetical protein